MPDLEPAEVYANWAANIRFDDLPVAIVDQSKRLILDTLACMIGASRESDVWQSQRCMDEMGGSPQARVVYTGVRMPAPNAAFVNGVMARCLDMGDVEREATHSSEFILPAILSGADHLGKSGQDVITAMAVGTEILARIARGCFAATMGVYQRAMQPPFVTSALVYPVGMLYGLTAEQLWDAAGLALSAPSSTDTQSTREGRSSGKRLMHGFAIQNAFTCVGLAKLGGLTATRKVFFGESGVVRTMYPDKHDPTAFTCGLGERWIAEIVQKKYPSCMWNHAPYEGTRGLMEAHGVNVEEIASLEYETGYRSVVEPRDEKWNPQSMQAAQFSLPYFVATSLLKRGPFFIEDYKNEALERKDVREMMLKISASFNPALSQKEKGNARVRMTLKNGRVVGWQDVPYPPGHPKLPLTWSDLAAKFMACADWVGLRKDQQSYLIETVRNLETVGDVRSMLDAMTRGERIVAEA